MPGRVVWQVWTLDLQSELTMSGWEIWLAEWIPDFAGMTAKCQLPSVIPKRCQPTRSPIARVLPP